MPEGKAQERPVPTGDGECHFLKKLRTDWYYWIMQVKWLTSGMQPCFLATSPGDLLSYKK
jgi:hypothetical protein